jgi:hypothetical protein
MLTAASAVRVGPTSALNYRALMSGGTAPDVTWWVNSELWFEGTAPTTPPPTQEPVGTNIWDEQKKAPSIVLSNGNLTATLPSGGISGLMALQSLISGKYYWEVTCDHAFALIGVATANWNLSYLDSGLFSYYSADGNLRPVDTAYGDAYGAGDVIGIALDLNIYKIWFSKNGVWQAGGDPAAGINPAFTSLPPNLGQYFPAAVVVNDLAQVTANFGASAFAYPVPSGFTPAAP